MFDNPLRDSRRRVCTFGLQITLAASVLFGSSLPAQENAFPTNEAFRRAAAVEVIERDPTAALDLFVAIAQDERVDGAIRRHAWLRIGLLLPRVDDPQVPWAASAAEARSEALARAAAGEDEIAERANEALAKESVDQERWNDLERQAEILVEAQLASGSEAMVPDRLASFLWIGQPAVGPILRAIKTEARSRNIVGLFQPLVRIDDPRVDAWMASPDTEVPFAIIAGYFNEALGVAHSREEHVDRYLSLLPRFAELLEDQQMYWSITRGLWSVDDLRRWCGSQKPNIARGATLQAIRQVLEGSSDEDAKTEELLSLFESDIPYLAANGPSLFASSFTGEPFVRTFLADNFPRFTFEDRLRISGPQSQAEARALLKKVLTRARPLLSGDSSSTSPRRQLEIASQLAGGALANLLADYPNQSIPEAAIELLELGLDIEHGPNLFMLLQSTPEQQRRLVEVILRHCRENPVELGGDRWTFDDFVRTNSYYRSADWSFDSILAGLATWNVEEPLPSEVWTRLGPALKAFVGTDSVPTYRFTQGSSGQVSTDTRERSERSIRSALLTAAKTAHPDVADWLLELWDYNDRTFGLGRIRAARTYHRLRNDDRSREAALRVFRLSSARESRDGRMLIDDLLEDPGVDWAAVSGDWSASPSLQLEDFLYRQIDDFTVEPDLTNVRVAWKPPLDETELARVWDRILEGMTEREWVRPAFEVLFLTTDYRSDEDQRSYLPLPQPLETVVLRHLDTWIERKLIPHDIGYSALLRYLWGTPRDDAQREKYASYAIASLSAFAAADDTEAVTCDALDTLPIEEHPALVSQLLDRVSDSSLAFGHLQMRRIPVPAERLEAALSTDDPVLITQFFRGVRRVPDQDLTKPVSSYLLRRIQEVGPQSTADVHAALFALSMIGEASVIPAALETYKRIPSLREQAQDIIDRVRYAIEQERLWETLGEDAPDLRPERVAIDLTTQARPDQDKQVRLLAIRSLGALGRPEPLGELIRFSQEQDADIATAAREAIAKILESED
ncbi:MAG: HEAT repeat domain-containing protein [Planctomycetota bacterium]